MAKKFFLTRPSLRHAILVTRAAEVVVHKSKRGVLNMNDDKMKLAIDLFTQLSIDEQIQSLEQEIERRGGNIPIAEELLRVLKKKREKLN